MPLPAETDVAIVGAGFGGLGMEMQERPQRSVWNSGCSSWYLDRNGCNSLQWPGFTFEYRRRTRRFDAVDYRLTPPAPAEAATAAPALAG